MALFDGVQNFTPAFTGRELAIRAGGGAAQSFSSGMNAGANVEQNRLAREKFDADQKDSQKQVEYINKFFERWRSKMSSSPGGFDFGGGMTGGTD